MRKESDSMEYEFKDYEQALDRAAQDHRIGFLELRKLADIAYPESC